MDRYLFLDIDGVLNDSVSDRLDIMKDHFANWDDICTNTLNKIVEVTGAKIVVTSSWRPNLGNHEANLKWLRDVFTLRGFKYPENIIGQTIRGYKEVRNGSSIPIPRGVEIKHWLDRHVVYPWHEYPKRSDEFKILNEDGSFKMMRHQEHNKDYVYAIIDDDNDMLLEHASSFFLTQYNDGLTPEIGEAVIEYLTRI